MVLMKQRFADTTGQTHMNSERLGQLTQTYTSPSYGGGTWALGPTPAKQLFTRLAARTGKELSSTTLAMDTTSAQEQLAKTNRTRSF